MDAVLTPSFAHLLRRFRRAASLTQEQLAERANLSARAVSDLERDDDRVPRRDTLELLADALRLSPEDRAILDQTVRRTHATSPPSQQSASVAAEPDANTPDDLPPQPTAFIGREHAVEAVRARLLDPETRLLTLTGPGGVGKTRLSLQAAVATRPAFADGVVFVPLAPIGDPDLVLSTIAQTLSVGETPGQAIGDTLAVSLRGKRMLLVLDNFEQVLLAGTPLMALLASAPDVKALVTSRSPLHVRGERVYPVSPLAVPTPPLPPLETLSQYEAVRLFIARAHDAQPDFVVTNETAPAVAEICARLDGLPLAIELAAARTRLLSPDALLARLSNRLKVVTGGGKDLPARQQTLRAAIDWSYSLLDPGEQTLFARLAVFVGGRTLEAVEAVCDMGGGLPFDALDGVESLLDKSLLRREAGANGEPRLVMLETIHEYARERLTASGEEKALREAHLAYYLQFAERAEPELVGSKQKMWLDRLAVEHDNLRAALGWTQEQGETERGLQVAATLWRFWLAHGRLSEGRDWLEKLLTDSPGAPTAIRAHALHGAGTLARVQGNYVRARALFDESMVLYRDQKDTRGCARVLNDLGSVAYHQGDYAGARALYAESLTLQQELGDTVGIANALGNLGNVAFEQGDYMQARTLLEKGLTLRRELGDTRGIAYSLSNLGGVTINLGDYEQARAWLEESLALHRESGDARGIAYSLNNLGVVEIDEGNDARARSLQETSLALHRKLGDKRGITRALNELGAVDIKRGDDARARVWLTESLALHQELGLTREVADCLESLAQAMAREQPARAVSLLSAAAAVRAAIGTPHRTRQQSVHEHFIGALRSILDETAFALAWTDGQAHSWQQLVAAIRGTQPDHGPPSLATTPHSDSREPSRKTR